MALQFLFSMEVAKLNRIIHDIDKYSPATFKAEACYLWIWNPTDIPPHMGISIDSSYFSLKSSGVDLGLDVAEMIQRIERTEIQVIALEIDQAFTRVECESIFSNYTRTVPMETTCLAPIKVVLKEDAPLKLSELLDILDSANRIRRATGWNISTTNIELPEYSVKDIHKYLTSLTK